MSDEIDPSAPPGASPREPPTTHADEETGAPSAVTDRAVTPPATFGADAPVPDAGPDGEEALTPELAPAGTPDSEPSAPEAAAAAPPRAPDDDAVRLAEALVFASADPVSPRSLQRLLPDDMDADSVLSALRERYAGRGVELVDAGGGMMFRTAADLAPRLRKVIESPRRLPRVAMETLAIVAYHQPITRPEIEHIRGSALSQQTLDSLLELNLIAPKGRRESPGRPTLWGTTPEFLAHFGLKDLRELPRREDLLLEPVPPRAQTVTQDLQTPAEPEAADRAENGPSGDQITG